MPFGYEGIKCAVPEHLRDYSIRRKYRRGPRSKPSLLP